MELGGIFACVPWQTASNQQPSHESPQTILLLYIPRCFDAHSSLKRSALSSVCCL
jgi:hypothetical protein